MEYSMYVVPFITFLIGYFLREILDHEEPQGGRHYAQLRTEYGLNRAVVLKRRRFLPDLVVAEYRGSCLHVAQEQCKLLNEESS